MTAMAQEYRRKPEVVQVVQWTGENLDELLAFNPDIAHIESAGQLHVQGAETIHTAWAGDWVARTATGSFYVVTNETLQDFYEPVE